MVEIYRQSQPSCYLKSAQRRVFINKQTTGLIYIYIYIYTRETGNVNDNRQTFLVKAKNNNKDFCVHMYIQGSFNK